MKKLKWRYLNNTYLKAFHWVVYWIFIKKNLGFGQPGAWTFWGCFGFIYFQPIQSIFKYAKKVTLVIEQMPVLRKKNNPHPYTSQIQWLDSLRISHFCFIQPDSSWFFTLAAASYAIKNLSRVIGRYPRRNSWPAFLLLVPHTQARKSALIRGGSITFASP